MPSQTFYIIDFQCWFANKNRFYRVKSYGMILPAYSVKNKK